MNRTWGSDNGHLQGNPVLVNVGLFDYSKDLEIEDFLESSIEEERDRLEDELEEITEQLDEREEIHEQLLEELEDKKDWYLDQLETLYLRNIGKQGDRVELKSRINEFYREIRSERRKHWRDRQKLEKERREILRELSELEDDSLDQLLDLQNLSI